MDFGAQELEAKDGNTVEKKSSEMRQRGTPSRGRMRLQRKVVSAAECETDEGFFENEEE